MSRAPRQAILLRRIGRILGYVALGLLGVAIWLPLAPFGVALWAWYRRVARKNPACQSYMEAVESRMRLLEDSTWRRRVDEASNRAVGLRRGRLRPRPRDWALMALIPLTLATGFAVLFVLEGLGLPRNGSSPDATAATVLGFTLAGVGAVGVYVRNGLDARITHRIQEGRGAFDAQFSELDGILVDLQEAFHDGRSNDIERHTRRLGDSLEGHTVSSGEAGDLLEKFSARMGGARPGGEDWSPIVENFDVRGNGAARAEADPVEEASVGEEAARHTQALRDKVVVAEAKRRLDPSQAPASQPRGRRDASPQVSDLERAWFARQEAAVENAVPFLRGNPRSAVRFHNRILLHHMINVERERPPHALDIETVALWSALQETWPVLGVALMEDPRRAQRILDALARSKPGVDAGEPFCHEVAKWSPSASRDPLLHRLFAQNPDFGAKLSELLDSALATTAAQG